MSNEEDF